MMLIVEWLLSNYLYLLVVSKNTVMFRDVLFCRNAPLSVKRSDSSLLLWIDVMHGMALLVQSQGLLLSVE